MRSKFITKNDVWGIRQAIKILWDKHCTSDWSSGNHNGQDDEIEFNAFYNQQIPETWRETLSTVKRHAEDIISIAKNPHYQGLVWYKRNGQVSSGYLNNQLTDAIKRKEIELPTYMEIEKEKQKWQSHPQYNKEKGFSSPLEEELIQIRIHK